MQGYINELAHTLAKMPQKNGGLLLSFFFFFFFSFGGWGGLRVGLFRDVPRGTLTV